MSKPIVDDNYNLWPDRPEPLEDSFRHATEKQISYIEILRKELDFSIPTHNAKIAGIIGVSFSGDMWSLSKYDAMKVIAQYIAWRVNR